MTSLIPVALFGWLPFVVLLFWFLPPRRAILAAFVLGWLFLPSTTIRFKGVPDLSKINVTSMAAFAGACLFDSRRILSFRPRWVDIPIFTLCFAPAITALQMNLGTRESASSVLFQVTVWGLPYFLGRVYFNDWQSFRDLGIAIFMGGLLYVPLCLLESRISPQLHMIVYGMHPGDGSFAHNYRWGGYRPVVFMQTGLATAMWMTTASIVGVWLWVSKSIDRVWNMKMSFLVPALLATTFWCKSTGALALLAVGLASLYWVKWTRNLAPLILLTLIPPVYMYQRGTMNWDGQWAIKQSENIFGELRATSLGVRIRNENRVVEHFQFVPDPMWGWGRYDPITGKPAYLPRNEFGISNVITDGLWLIILGQYGIVGLCALMIATMMPVFIIWRRVPVRLWWHPMTGAAVAMMMLLLLFTIDNLLNAMINPIFILGLGGLCAIGPSVRKLLRQQQYQQRAGLAGAAAQPMYGAAGPARPAPAYAAQAARSARGRGEGQMAGFPAIPGLRAPGAPPPRR